MTPERFREVAEAARMTRNDMNVFKEKIAPLHHEERTLLPLYSLY